MPLDASRLRSTIESITDLPTLPTLLARITGQIANPATNAADIGKLIEQDQALTGKVLRLVNSAYYGFPKQIKSVQHAVVILGFNKVKTIVITASVFGAFRGRPQGGLDLRRFWQHALGTALSSKAVAEHFGAAHLAEDAFVAGLLHDVGKVVMDQYQPNIYGPIVKYAMDKGSLLVDAEKEVMGLTHADVGGWLMEKWRLPPTLVNLVLDHHTLSASQERRELILSIHLGDILTRAIGIGSGGDQRIPEIDPLVSATFGMEPAALDILVAKTMEVVEKANDFFSLLASGV